MDRRWRLVGVGAGWALLVALPAALLAQVADAATAGDHTSPLVYPCALVVLAAMAVGGWMVARRDPAASPATGALAGLAAIAAIQLLGVLRSLAGGDDVAWATIPFLSALGAGLGAAGTALARQRPGRTRP